jgi:hypothetical protein
LVAFFLRVLARITQQRARNSWRGIAFAVSEDGSETCLSKSPILLIAKRIALAF